MAHCYDALFHWNGLLDVTIRTSISDDVAQARVNAFMGKGVQGVVTDRYRNHLNTFVKYLDCNPVESGFLVGERLSVADCIKHMQEATTWFPLPDRALRLTSPEELTGLVRLPE